jgi:hypothetical protein
MSTKVGIIAEGPIDHVLIPSLLERIARDRAEYDWPVLGEDIAEVFQIRKRGHGGVLETVRRLVIALDDPAVYSHAFFVILLDRRTRAVQEEIRQLLVNHNRFVLAVAIEEIEAWWLGDRENTLVWSGLKDALPDDCRYAEKNYRSERDGNPKKTLDELTRVSDRFDRCYGEGNVDLAREFSEDYWRRYARLDDIRSQCPQGYRPFEKAATQQFRSASRRAGRLFGRSEED